MLAFSCQQELYFRQKNTARCLPLVNAAELKPEEFSTTYQSPRSTDMTDYTASPANTATSVSYLANRMPFAEYRHPLSPILCPSFCGQTPSGKYKSFLSRLVEKNDARAVLQTLVGRYCNFCNTSGVDSELICSLLANVISAICNLPVCDIRSPVCSVHVCKIRCACQQDTRLSVN